MYSGVARLFIERHDDFGLGIGTLYEAHPSDYFLDFGLDIGGLCDAHPADYFDGFGLEIGELYDKLPWPIEDLANWYGWQLA